MVDRIILLRKLGRAIAYMSPSELKDANGARKDIVGCVCNVYDSLLQINMNIESSCPSMDEVTFHCHMVHNRFITSTHTISVHSLQFIEFGFNHQHANLGHAHIILNSKFDLPNRRKICETKRK